MKIFFFEALCVCSAVHEARDLAVLDSDSHYVHSTLAVFTDNTNTVDIFNSLRAKPVFNEILKSAIDMCLEYNFNLRVLHIPGVDNRIADALSRDEDNMAISLALGLLISYFQPPQLPALGAAGR